VGLDDTVGFGGVDAGAEARATVCAESEIGTGASASGCSVRLRSSQVPIPTAATTMRIPTKPGTMERVCGGSAGTDGRGTASRFSAAGTGRAAGTGTGTGTGTGAAARAGWRSTMGVAVGVSAGAGAAAGVGAKATGTGGGFPNSVTRSAVEGRFAGSRRRQRRRMSRRPGGIVTGNAALSDRSSGQEGGLSVSASIPEDRRG